MFLRYRSQILMHNERKSKMKIEIGESLVLSWLKHINNCQLVQLNWKPSVMAWEYHNEENVENIINRIQTAYSKHFDIFKKNKNASQIIKQGEIDALGLELSGVHVSKIYAVDVAFHEGGLNYGDKSTTIAKVISKLTRMAITLYGYFDTIEGEIIFATPKINPAVKEPLEKSIQYLNRIFKEEFKLDFNFVLICNENFKSRLIDQLDLVSKEVADTSELYMRSIQMYKMFEKNFSAKNQVQKKTAIRTVKDMNHLEIIDDYKDIKIGALVRLSLPKLLQNGSLDDEMIKNLQESDFSKETFDMNYPILKKIDHSKSKMENRYVGGYTRYYSFVTSYKGFDYLISSEWYDRNKAKYVLWLELYAK